MAGSGRVFEKGTIGDCQDGAHGKYISILPMEFPGLAFANISSRQDNPTTVEGEDGDPARRPSPRFQLQGRVSLSLQDFAEVPSYMVAQASPPIPHLEDSCSMPSDGFVPPAYMQQMHQDMHQDSSGSMAFSALGSSFSRKRSRSDKLDLEMLLNSTSKGKMILSLYRQRNCLDGPARQTLTDLVIAEELREDFNKRITSQRFQEIAESIVELFPGENEVWCWLTNTYYCLFSILILTSSSYLFIFIYRILTSAMIVLMVTVLVEREN